MPTVFYHLRATIAGERGDETKIDLSADDLNQQFLEPYSQGRPITMNGRVIELRDLIRLRISSSDESAKSFYPALKARDANSKVFNMGGPTYPWRAAAMATDVTDEFITGPPGKSFEATGSAIAPQHQHLTVPVGPGDRRSVFLVHGRDSVTASAVSSFLRALDLKVIEWEQAVNLTGEPNPYIGDVLAIGLESADAVVVLAAPEDIVRLDPDLATGPDDPELEEARQPRQNVIFEAGMAMALAPTRTLIIAVRGTKIPSDISGRHLAYVDNSASSRKRIVGRLQVIGLAVDDSGTAWLESGDFGE